MGALLFVTAIALGGVAQNEVRVLVGEPESPALHIVGIAAVALGLGVVLVLAARGVRRLTRW